jgi:hypothetical protein
MDYSAEVNETNFYMISSVNQLGEGPTKQIVVSAPPVDITCTENEDNIEVRWSQSEDQLTSSDVDYHVYRGTSPDNMTHVFTQPIYNYYFDRSVQEGVTYNYSVKVVVGNVEGYPSRPVEISYKMPVEPGDEEDERVVGDYSDTYALFIFSLVFWAVGYLFVLVIVISRSKEKPNFKLFTAAFLAAANIILLSWVGSTAFPHVCLSGSFLVSIVSIPIIAGALYVSMSTYKRELHGWLLCLVTQALVILTSIFIHYRGDPWLIDLNLPLYFNTPVALFVIFLLLISRKSFLQPGRSKPK